MQISGIWTALWRLVCRDTTRANLGHVRINLRGGRATATDGYLLVDLPIGLLGEEPEEGLPPEIFVDRKAARALGNPEILHLEAVEDLVKITETVQRRTQKGTLRGAVVGAAAVDYPDTEILHDCMGSPPVGAFLLVDPELLGRVCTLAAGIAGPGGKRGRRMWLGVVSTSSARALAIRFEPADYALQGEARAIIMGVGMGDSPPHGWGVFPAKQ